MSNRHVCMGAAAVVLAVTAAFAQTTQQTPTPTAAQSSVDRPAGETPITVVGCLQREADYRRAQSSGRGGILGTGTGLANELVLINASVGTGMAEAGGTTTEPTATAGTSGTTAGTSGTPASTTGTPASTTGTPASTTGTPADTAGTAADTAGTAGAGARDAYELTGSKERELEKLAGRRVEITGMLKRAAVDSGTGKPTGGVDPMGDDLRLHEVNVTSFRELGNCSPAPQRQEAAAAAASPEPEPAAPVRSEEPAAQPVGTSGTEQELPRTASPLPLAGLIGLLSLGGALAVRRYRR